VIELVSEQRCVDCNLCVAVCPTNVFDAQPSGPPRIARPEDCQTCFMCELYCPTDALYVSPLLRQRERIDEQELIEQGQLGSYARHMGWRRAKPGGSSCADPTFRLRAATPASG
jgi:NAD-dependent dihydropyrimidine dehydrogenase PreA subunit